MKQMWRNGGLATYYRGLWAGLGGIFPYAALDLGTFEVMKRGYITREAKRLGCENSDVKIGNMAVLTMGALSGSVGATVVYPINLLRTRLQAQGTAAHPQTYTGIMDAYHKAVTKDGYRGLFRGLAPNLAKVAPAVSISYLVYENTKTMLGLE
jgi:solute carrier family 25 phosphate transporter 23/24/25/41